MFRKAGIRSPQLFGAFCIFGSALGALLFPATAHAQKQVVRISTLTKLPARADNRPTYQQQMKPAQPMVIPQKVKITKPLAWNRTDRYEPPNFKEFFPDDPAGGKQLDDLFGGKLGGSHSADDVLAVVRRGLRRTTRHRTLILAEVGKGFVWGIEDQHPAAIELLYHASDTHSQNGSSSHYALYHGLTVVNQRSSNLIRTLMERFTSYDHEIQNRILWGFQQYGDKQHTTALLDRYLQEVDPHQQDDSGIVAALDVYQKLTGKPFPHLERFDNAGQFVIAFQKAEHQTKTQLHDQLLQWASDKKAVLEFVLRQSEGNPTGVGLVQGVKQREQILNAIEADPQASLIFSETFAPTVLLSRQLREFAKFLPKGLPDGAKPVYRPVPQNESFAWNATGETQPPDYFSYFPDDPVAGKELDQLYAKRNELTLSSREILEKIRQGLRHSEIRKNVLMGWVSSVSGWPEDPMAKEIAYHAADPKADQNTRYNAVYFGLSGWWEKSENVLHLFADILATEPYDHSLGHNLRGRILWSLREPAEKQFVAARIAKALENHAQYSPELLYLMTQAYQQLADKKPSNFEEYAARGYFFVGFRHKDSRTPDQMRQVVKAEFGKQKQWVDFFASQQQQQQISGMAVVRGMGGMEWLIAALQNSSNRYSIDIALPSAALANIDEKSAKTVPEFERLKKYLTQE